MYKILVIDNGDKRIKHMIKYLQQDNTVVELKEELKLFYELSDKTCDCLVLPVRGLNNEFIVDGTNIKITDNYFMLMKNKILFTGLVNDALREKCHNNEIKLISYLDDDFAIKNNYITVEGVIDTIVTNSEKAIFNANILIIGYGRLGQIAAKILKSMKANVTISARNEKDFVHAKISEYNTINNLQIIDIIDKFDFVINTIPFRILDSETLNKLINKDTLIIDVASDPFGLDHEYAKQKNIKVFKLPGIPGKIAPITSGNLLGEIILKYLIGGENIGGK